MIQPFEICWGTVRFNDCLDRRPLIVVAVTADSATVMRVSFQFDLFQLGDFVILESDPDFPATGLKHESYVPNTDALQIPLAALGPRKGVLAGHLLAAFRTWYG